MRHGMTVDTATRLLRKAGHQVDALPWRKYGLDGRTLTLRELREAARALPLTVDLTTGRYELRK